MEKYRWRNLTDRERRALVSERVRLKRPWHSPPIYEPSQQGSLDYLISAACFRHSHFMGRSKSRMEVFSQALLLLLAEVTEEVTTWCVLPNHYHALVRTDDLRTLKVTLGRLHGRAAYIWNLEEATRGRRVFYRASDRAIRSRGHFFTSINYIHKEMGRMALEQRGRLP